MSLNEEELQIEGYIFAKDGSYNPRYSIYDSQFAAALYVPRGVYVDLAEMQLMYDAGKLPLFVSYTSFVDTDLHYEQSHPQLIVFIADSQIYPLFVFA